MKNTILFIFFALYASNIIGQNTNDIEYRPLINGTEYKITQENNAGNSPKKGDLIKMTLYKFDNQGQLIFSTEMLDAPNGVEMVLSEKHLPGDIMDVFLQMKSGESAEALVPIWIADNDTTLKNQTEKYRYTVELHSFKTQEENKKER